VPDLDRARRWLRQHRLGGIEPTPLLAARLDARRAGLVAELATIAIVMAGMLAWSFVVRWGSGPDEPGADDFVWLASFYVALIAGMAVGFWWRRRLEWPLLQTMTVRSAHPAATSAVRVLGERRLAAAVAVNGGCLAVGAVAALLAPAERDRAIALAVLVGVAVLAALGSLILASVLRRPSLAEDSESLAVDDRLRLEDAKRALMPYALPITLSAALDSTLSPPVAWLFRGYVVVAAVCYVLGERCRTRVTVPQ
jgi:hypothetical protein